MKECTLIEKLRKPEIFGMKIFDWLVTILAIFLISYTIYYYFDMATGIPFWQFFIGLFIAAIMLGIFLHWLLDVDTMLGYYLGINKPPIRIKCV